MHFGGGNEIIVLRGRRTAAWLDQSQKTPRPVVRPAADWCCWLPLCSTHSSVHRTRGEGTQFHKLVSRGHICAEIFSRGDAETHPGCLVSRELLAVIRAAEVSVSREPRRTGVWSESLVSSGRREEVKTVHVMMDSFHGNVVPFLSKKHHWKQMDSCSFLGCSSRESQGRFRGNGWTSSRAWQ